jgi:hypothetical protein
MASEIIKIYLNPVSFELSNKNTNKCFLVGRIDYYSISVIDVSGIL